MSISLSGAGGIDPANITGVTESSPKNVQIPRSSSSTTPSSPSHSFIDATVASVKLSQVEQVHYDSEETLLKRLQPGDIVLSYYPNHSDAIAGAIHMAQPSSEIESSDLFVHAGLFVGKGDDGQAKISEAVGDGVRLNELGGERFRLKPGDTHGFLIVRPKNREMASAATEIAKELSASTKEEKPVHPYSLLKAIGAAGSDGKLDEAGLRRYAKGAFYAHVGHQPMDKNGIRDFFCSYYIGWACQAGESFKVLAAANNELGPNDKIVFPTIDENLSPKEQGAALDKWARDLTHTQLAALERHTELKFDPKNTTPQKLYEFIVKHPQLFSQEILIVAPKQQEVAAPTRQVAGKRIYHTKSDILPWVTNIYNAARLSIKHVYNEFEKVVNASDLDEMQKSELLHKARAQVVVELKKLETAEKETLSLPEFSIKGVLLPEKDEVKGYKKISQSIEKGVHGIIQSCARSIESAATGILNPDTIETFGKKMTDNAASIEGLMRFEIIHQDEFWNPDKVTHRYMGFTSDSSNETIMADSTFQAMGPAYSSQAPRNRTEENACAPNFFRSTLSVKAQGSDTEVQILDVTRSAITVEFDQPDFEERQKANRHNLKQVLDVQVANLIEKTDQAQLESASSKEHPLVLKSQTVNLLTPDILRTFARAHPTMGLNKLHHALSGAAADDERTLALENLSAHRALNDLVIPYDIVDKEGTPRTIFVKYDLRYFNIPNNSLYEKTPKVATSSVELQKANDESFAKLENDALSYSNKLGKQLAAVELPSPVEKATLEDLVSKVAKLHDMRFKVMSKTLHDGKINNNSPEFISWQKEANALSQEIKEIEKLPLSDACKEAIKILQMKRNLDDLRLDTTELYEGGFSLKLANMDNNRSALAVRIILLGALIEDIEVHFGCRSGKDRTGLVDIELKLLATETKLTGRVLSYREQEKLPSIVDHREIMTMESGNVFDFVKANLGANVGLNSGGSASKPLEENEKGEQQIEFTESAQAFASMASRPKVNRDTVVPSGYRESTEVLTAESFIESMAESEIEKDQLSSIEYTPTPPAAEQTSKARQTSTDRTTALATAKAAITLFTNDKARSKLNFVEFNKAAETLKQSDGWENALSTVVGELNEQGLKTLSSLTAVSVRGYDRGVLFTMLKAVETTIKTKQLSVPSAIQQNLSDTIASLYEAPIANPNLIPLGEGKVNTVYSVTYNGQTEQEVFKPDLSGKTAFTQKLWGSAAGAGIPSGIDAHFQSRAVASSEVDQLLFGDKPISVKTRFATLRGKRGILMEHAVGASPKVTEKTVVISPAQLKSLQGIGINTAKPTAEDLKEIAHNLKLSKVEVTNGKLTGTSRTFTNFSPDNSTTAEGLLKLQVLDWICGQVDRHPGNYFVDQNNGTVKGIDQDCAFGVNAVPVGVDVREQKKLKGIVPNMGSLMLRMPPVVTKDVLANINALSNNKEGLKTSLKRRLTDAEVDATIRRLDMLHAHVNSKACIVVETKDDLLSENAKKALNPDNSYWAREVYKYNSDEKNLNYLRNPTQAKA